MTLSNPTGGAALGGTATAVLTIVDNDVAPAGTLQFSAATYGVAENGGNATVTITRTGGSTGAVGVTVATSNGTATAPSDYTAVSQTVNFAAGDTASKTVNIPIVNDTLVEANETVNVTLSNPTGGATVGSPGSAVLTISDNDSGSPTLTASPATIAAGGTVTASWSGISTPTPRDWIGLYAPGAAQTAFIDWMYVSCSKTPGSAAPSGSCPFVVPSAVPPGTYQLRIFGNNQFTPLATSNAFSVTAPVGVTLTVSPTTVVVAAKSPHRGMGCPPRRRLTGSASILPVPALLPSLIGSMSAAPRHRAAPRLPGRVPSLCRQRYRQAHISCESWRIISSWCSLPATTSPCSDRQGTAQCSPVESRVVGK